jgi:hypothetical protein
MRNLIPVYLLRNGNLDYKEFNIPFSFGIVYFDEGQYLFELFLDNDYPLGDILEANRNIYLKKFAFLEAFLDSGEIFKASNIFPLRLEPSIGKITLECLDRVTIEKSIDDKSESDLSESLKQQNLFFIKLEGLKMSFSNNTDVQAYRNHKEISWHLLQDYFWDHSVCVIKIGGVEYKTIWRKDIDEEIIIEFLFQEYQYQSMPYAVYTAVKNDFISLLSFLNGAEVRVREEYTGDYFSQPKLDSQIKHLYSFRKEKPRSYNAFIPLDDEWFKAHNIINRVFMWDFNRYRFWNSKLDFNSIIYILGNAQQIPSIDERVFIQMILLERLSDSYALINPISNPKLIDEEIFSIIKNELNQVLEKNETKLTVSQFSTIKSRLFGLNDGKRQRTDIKIVSMLQEVGIEITNEIRKVINEDRHTIIHKGEIGSRKTFEILDRLLRQVIINLIKYNGPTSATAQGGNIGIPIWEAPEKYFFNKKI